MFWLSTVSYPGNLDRTWSWNSGIPIPDSIFRTGRNRSCRMTVARVFRPNVSHVTRLSVHVTIQAYHSCADGPQVLGTKPDHVSMDRATHVSPGGYARDAEQPARIRTLH